MPKPEAKPGLVWIVTVLVAVAAQVAPPRAMNIVPESDTAGAAASVDADGPTEPFPTFACIRGNVVFWIRVFSEWKVGQAVVHHIDHPDIVYEVLELPGPVADKYSDEQQDFLERRRDQWRDWLAGLREKVSTRAELDDVEKRWVLEITAKGGYAALENAPEQVRTQRGLRERFLEGLERSSRYDARIRQAFRQAGLPEDLAYLPHVESSFRPDARSSAGAVGLWQLTRTPARRHLSVDSATDERLDPVISTRGAVGYLTDAIEKLESWPIALTSYNHGVQGMMRAAERFGADFERIYREYDGRHFGFASKNFYAEFLAAREIARDPIRYFPESYSPEPPLDYDEIVLSSKATPAEIASTYGIPLSDLAVLNPAWTSRAIRHGLALPAEATVWLPRGTLDRLAADRASRAAQPGMLAETGRYVVRRGDTLSGIARTLGVGLAALRQLNEIPSGNDLIRVGQSLLVPVEAAADVTHVVRRGETLIRIASAYGIGLVELLTANGLSDESIIHPGQAILIPTAR